MELYDDIKDMFAFTSWGKCFAEQDVKQLATRLERLDVRDGEKIFNLGDKDFYLSYIIKGKVAILKDYEGEPSQTIVTLSGNTFFGEISLVDGLPRSASAVAKGDVSLAILPKSEYDKILEENPALAVKLQKSLLLVLAKRLRFTTLEFIRLMQK